MAVSHRNKIILWARAAGRCQYRGCNAALIGDLVARNLKINKAYIAHIVAESPTGPRGDPVLSEALADDIGNLMLLCDAHHRLIDGVGLDEHPVEVLHAMKAAHENRIELATSIDHSRATRMLFYGQRIGEHGYPLNKEMARQALLTDLRFSEPSPIELSWAGYAARDDESAYWQAQADNLKRQFRARVLEHLEFGDVAHLSLFALAPQPLLVLLGHLLSDIPSVEVYQLHREPQDWKWRDGPAVDFDVAEPELGGEQVALKISLSATVTDDRICRVLGPETPIWSLTTATPNNDLMQTRSSLAAFRATARRVLDQIKARHGEHATIHVFPAMPVSAAIEFGRIRMPKADLPLVVYDQSSSVAGFVPRIHLPESPAKEA